MAVKVLEGQNSSGRPVGFISTTPGTWRTSWGRVLARDRPKQCFCLVFVVFFVLFLLVWVVLVVVLVLLGVVFLVLVAVVACHYFYYH